MTSVIHEVEQAVIDRYSKGAKSTVAELCCAVDYDPQYLAAIPEEIIRRDYGCGDPSPHLRQGETVLDLGSGGGKICYIASQIVGPEGRVIGIDMNQDMLNLARDYQAEVARNVGWDNVEFRRGRIQDLQLDIDALGEWLVDHPVRTPDDLAMLQAEQDRLSREQPLVADQSVDVVVSNCVLNLVEDGQKPLLFAEIFRVLKRGGRAVIADIVADEPVPDHLKSDPELWSGCISGAMTEQGLIEAFEAAGFYGAEILGRNERPWRTVEGIEFRSMTIRAYRGKEGPCIETNKALIYRGPWKEVADDDGHLFRRGERAAVCEKSFVILTGEPYVGEFEPVLPHAPIDPEQQQPFDCTRTAPRHPRESKGQEYDATTEAAGPACSDDSCC